MRFSVFRCASLVINDELHTLSLATNFSARYCLLRSKGGSFASSNITPHGGDFIAPMQSFIDFYRIRSSFFKFVFDDDP